MPVPRRFMDDDPVVQTLTANRMDHPLDVRTRRRHSGRSQYFLNPKFLHLLGEARTEDAVAVRSKKRGALSQGNASRSGCAVHSAVA